MITTKEDDLDRRTCPHHVVITMKIDIRKIKPDGCLDHQVIGNKLLSQYGITNKAQICFSAPTEADAVKMLKEKVKRLEDEN